MFKLKKRLSTWDNIKTFAAVLSFFGSMIAISYLKDDITNNIPIRLKYTAYAPKISGE